MSTPERPPLRPPPKGWKLTVTMGGETFSVYCSRYEIRQRMLCAVLNAKPL
jgi:hypothetical protein